MSRSRLTSWCVLLVAALTLLTGVSAAWAQDGGGEALHGTLRGPDGPLEGVQLVATDEGGDPVGEATTDDGGNWRIELPGPGAYTLTLDQDSLPEGLTVRDEDLVTRDFEVAEGKAQGVLFPIEGEQGGAASENVQRMLNLIISGLKLGAIIAMTSVGLSLIFGVTGLVNFAHGELVTFGAVVAYVLHAGPDGRRLSLVAAGILATIAGGLMGAAMDRGLFRPLRNRKTGLISMLVITIGLSFGARHVIQIFFGTSPRKYIDYAVQRDALTLGPFSLAPRDWTVILISVVVLGGVGLLLQRTRLGTAMRAVADNRDLAESSGIDVKRVILAVWILGGALAALGGVLQGVTSRTITFDMGFALLLLMFAGVIVGGIGTAYGAMVGGMFVGLASEVSTFWFSIELKLVFAFLLLIAVLLVRPQGILGRRERIG